MQQNKIYYQTILLETTGHLATLTLNRPEQKNAINTTMMDELLLAINHIKNEKVSILLLKSNGNIFCAGADLKQRREMSEKQVFEFLNSFKQLLLDIENLPFPTLCAIQGDAYGGGVEISLAFDIRYISTTAGMALTETKLGIIPGAGGTQRLPRIVGKSRAMEWIFSGRKIDAQTAFAAGLVNGFSEPEFFEEYVNNKTKEILSSAPLSLRFAKKAINDGTQTDIQTALEIERDEYLKTLNTKDRMEALIAFSEKRKPNFIGE